MRPESCPNASGRLKAATDKLEAGIAELFDSGRYTEYLATMSKFHQYSLRLKLRRIIFLSKRDGKMRKRNKHVSVWLTEQEHRHLREQAELSGLGIDPFIRNGGFLHDGNRPLPPARCVVGDPGAGGRACAPLKMRLNLRLISTGPKNVSA